MARMTHLQRKPGSGMWRYVRRVPTELVPLFNKAKLTISLGTRDQTEASRRYGPVHTKVEADFDSARKGDWPRLDPEVLEIMAIHWWNDEPRTEPMNIGELTKSVTAYAARSARLIKTQYLLQRFMKAAIEIHDESFIFDKIQSNTQHPSAPSVQIPDEALPNRSIPLSTGVKINLPFLSVVKKYQEATENINKSSAGEWATIMKRFTDILGKNILIRNITPEDIVYFKEQISLLPKNVLSKQWKNMNTQDIIRKAQTLPDVQTIKINTISKHIAAVSSIFGWAIQNKYADFNPTNKLKNREDNPWRPFTIDELNLIFSSPPYCEIKNAIDRDEHFWIPLIALFTGCRLEEIGQLKIKDIRKHDSIWIMDVNSLEDKSVKTRSSNRLIPIHKSVLDCGFINYVNHLREAGNTRVFPNVESSKRQKTARFSGDWAAHLNDLGLNDPTLVFHSFRHNFADAAVECEVDERTKDVLMGHSGGGTGRTYGIHRKSVPFRQLVKGISLISYPGLILNFYD